MRQKREKQLEKLSEDISLPKQPFFDYRAILDAIREKIQVLQNTIRELTNKIMHLEQENKQLKTQLQEQKNISKSTEHQLKTEIEDKDKKLQSKASELTKEEINAKVKLQREIFASRTEDKIHEILAKKEKEKSHD